MDTIPTPNKPVATYRDGKLKCALWQNQNRDGDVYYTITPAKTYEDRNGKLQETHSFSDSEAPRLAELIRETRAHALELRREQSHDRKQQHSQERDTRQSDGGAPRRFQDRSGPGMER